MADLTAASARRGRGVAQLKVLLKGNVGTDLLTVVPPNPGSEAGLILDEAVQDQSRVDERQRR